MSWTRTAPAPDRARGPLRRHVPSLAAAVLTATMAIATDTEVAVAADCEARTTTQFTLDTEFNENAWDGALDASNVRGAALLTDRSVVLVGDLREWGGTSTPGIQRFGADGTFDATFNQNLGTGEGAGDVRAALALASGDVAVAGRFTTFDGAPSGAVVVLNPDGTRDSGFASRLGGDVRALAGTSDGGLVVAGAGLTFDGAPITSGVARLAADGSLDAQFSANLAGGLDASTPLTGSTATADGVAVGADGSVYVTGNFTTFGGSAPAGIVKLAADGVPDPTFSGGTGFDLYGLAISIDQDGALLVGGAFTAFDGVAAPGLVRLSTDGQVDTDFLAAFGTGPRSGANPGTVAAVRQLADGTILIGGTFGEVSGEIGVGLYSLSSDGAPQRGSFATDLPSGVTSTVRAFADDPIGGTVIVAGQIGPHPGGLIRTPRGFYRLSLESMIVGPVDDQVTPLGAAVDLVVPAVTYPVPGLPISFSAAGAPPGVQIDPTTGAFSGAPTTVGVYETCVTGAKDGSDLYETIAFLWTVTEGPTLTGDAPDTVVGATYPAFAYAITGYPTPTVSVTSGALPDGLVLAPDGTLTGSATTAGTFAFTVTATNGTAVDATLDDTITVTQAPAISGQPPAGVTWRAYPGFAFTTSGQPGPTLSLAEGDTLPPGLSLDPTTGAISGTPTTAGTFAFTVIATNGVDPDATLDTSITITAEPVATVDQGIVQAGDPQTVRGTGFSAGDTVTVVLNSTPVALGTLTADARGELQLTFTVPAGTETGRHTVVLTGAVSGVATAAFEVTAPPSGDGVLATTGAVVGGSLLLASGLTLLGGLLIAAARRRSPTA
jgi:hypothetical protein